MRAAQTEPGSFAWVTGAGGLIGNYLVQTAKEWGIKAVGLTRADLDITDFAAVERRFHAEQPPLIIHCAAISSSPDCQANPAKARAVNVDATAHLAALARESDFLFFSSDLVFDGKKGDYVETDAVNPLTAYAETKVAAEQIILKNGRHKIVRTSINSGASPKGNTAYNELMREGWHSRQTDPVFSLTNIVAQFRPPSLRTRRGNWWHSGLAEFTIWPGRNASPAHKLENSPPPDTRKLNPRIEECSLKGIQRSAPACRCFAKIAPEFKNSSRSHCPNSRNGCETIRTTCFSATPGGRGAFFGGRGGGPGGGLGRKIAPSAAPIPQITPRRSKGEGLAERNPTSKKAG